MLEDNKLDVEKARYNMIEQMLRPWYILNQRVLDAFHNVPREAFVPEEYKGLAYSEMRIPLNENVSMLSPVIEGRLLQEIRIQETESVLIVGTGSGFLATCAAYLGKHVTSIDVDPELNTRAVGIVGQLNLQNITFKTADIRKDALNLEKYDVVILTGSVERVSKEFYSLLNDNGRLFAVVGKESGMSAEIHYNYAGRIQVDSVFETQLERLVGFEDRPEFVF